MGMKNLNDRNVKTALSTVSFRCKQVQPYEISFSNEIYRFLVLDSELPQ